MSGASRGGRARSLRRSTVAAFTASPRLPLLLDARHDFQAHGGPLRHLKNNPFLFQQPPTLEHLRFLLAQTLFLRWLGNTALVGALVVAITLAAGRAGGLRPRPADRALGRNGSGSGSS